MNADARRWTLIVVVVVLLVLLAVGLSLAGSAGFLPWQPEPTRPPITPFANLPQANSAATPVP